MKKPLPCYLTKKLFGAIATIAIISFICFSVVGSYSSDLLIRRRFGLFKGYISPEDYERLYNEFGFELGLLWEDGSEINFFTRYFQWLGLVKDNTGSFTGLLQGDFGDSWHYDFNIEGLLLTKIVFTSIFLAIFCGIYFSIAFFYSYYKINYKKIKFRQISRNFSRILIVVPSLLLGLFLSLTLWSIFTFDSRFSEELVSKPYLLDKNFYQFLIPPFLIMFIWSLFFTIGVSNLNEETIVTNNYRTYLKSTGYSSKIQMRLLSRNIIIFHLHYIRENLSIIYSVSFFIENIFNLPGLMNSFLLFARYRVFPASLNSILIICSLAVVNRLLLDFVLAIVDPEVIKGKSRFLKGTLNTKWVRQY